MWEKRYENKNVQIKKIQELHEKLKEVFGETFLEIFDYVPPESQTTEANAYFEIRFESEPSDIGALDEILDDYLVE